MVQKHIVISMIAPVAVAGILIMTILAATANAQENNNTGNPQQPVAGCGPGTDNSTCSTTPNTQAPAAPTTAGCGPGTDNSTCSTTPNTQAPAAAPTTAGCGPGTDNSTCSANPTPTPTPTPGNASSSPAGNNITAADFVNTILAIHNRERALVGSPPLVWSDSLAAGAQAWAPHVATGAGHSPGTDRPGQGENIASQGFTVCDATSCHGIHGVGQLTKMVESWVAEKNNYHGGVVDQSNLYQVGHYTQVVWRDTTQIGCGMATASDGVNDYLVCRYSPAGNQFGQKPY